MAIVLALGFLAVGAVCVLSALHAHEHAETSDCGACHHAHHAPGVVATVAALLPLCVETPLNPMAGFRLCVDVDLESAGERAPPTLS